MKQRLSHIAPTICIQFPYEKNLHSAATCTSQGHSLYWQSDQVLLLEMLLVSCSVSVCCFIFLVTHCFIWCCLHDFFMRIFSWRPLTHTLTTASRLPQLWNPLYWLSSVIHNQLLEEDREKIKQSMVTCLE